jgi:hypothetical protein
MFNRIGILLRTIRFIKPIQVIFQLKNRLIKTVSYKSYRYPFKQSPKILSLIPDFKNNSSSYNDRAFTFLNLSVVFPEKIDWNYSVNGKLWNYNLQYLDYIHQEDINLVIRLGWIEEIYSALYSGNLKPEPYPASLRAMNVIRFFSYSSMP